MSFAENTFTTDEARKIRVSIEERIGELVRKLESPDLNERETAVTRGGIMELRRLLAVRPPHVGPLRYSGVTRGL